MNGHSVYRVGVAGLACLLLTGCQSVGPIARMADTAAHGTTIEKGSLAGNAGRKSGVLNTSAGTDGGQRKNLASLNEIVRRNPQDANALNMRGSAYAKARQYDRAYRDFSVAIELDPHYHQAYANRALVRVRQKRFQEAMADFEKALEISPGYTAALLGRADIFRRRKMMARAVADYNKVIELDPSNAMAYFQRGTTYQLMGRHEKAISDFDVAIGLRPETPAPYFARGQSRFVLQQFETAYDDFYIAAKRGRGRGADVARAWTFRGLSAERFGDRKKAVRAYRRALQVVPRFKPALDGMRRLGVKAA